MMYQCPWCDGGLGYSSLWGAGLVLLFGLLVVAGIVLIVIWAVRGSGDRGKRPVQPSDPALDAARRRYASGEITAEEYEEIRTNLQS